MEGEEIEDEEMEEDIDDLAEGKKGFEPVEEQEAAEQERILERYEDTLFSRLFPYASDRMCLFAVGMLFALANGTISPLFGLLLARMLNALLDLSNNSSQAAMDQANVFALWFLVLGVASFISMAMQMAIFRVIGGSMTARLRGQVFDKLMRLPVPFFDLPRNGSASLVNRLSTECSQANALITATLPITVQNISTLAIGLTISFSFEWRTSLVALGLFPLLLILEIILKDIESSSKGRDYEGAAGLMKESMANIRAVNSQGNEAIFKRYEQ